MGDGGGEVAVGVGSELFFPAHPLRAQFHNWEWLRGVVLPGDRGMGVSHYVTFHVTLGRCLFMNSPLSFKLQVLPAPPMSLSTEIQDIKSPFWLPFSEEKPLRRALFSP